MARKFRPRSRDLLRRLEPIAKFLLKSRLLAVFFALCVAGVAVGLWNRPDRSAIPYAELFRELRVVSYRDSPSDTTAHFVVDLSAGGKVFRRYDVDLGTFIDPPPDREYNRGITGSVYQPLALRGHVAQGLWLDVPRLTRFSLLPQQFDELYRATLDFVKPVSLVAGALGTLSGYSVGYRLGDWNSSLRSRAVQERVLAMPGLGPAVARDAWRRVLLEPLVMATAQDPARIAATHATHRIYANFFKLALNDSDGFIPREAGRLASLGRTEESRAMLDFAESVRRAKAEAPVTSADFRAVERWASLLSRRGHWSAGATPAAGEERSRYFGTLAWYGVAPPSAEIERIWIGPRLLVREGDLEGFVADDIPATGVGCPTAWRDALRDRSTGPNAWATAWFADHPEFRALAAIATRAGAGAGRWAQALAARRAPAAARPQRPRTLPPVALPAAAERVTVEPVRDDSLIRSGPDAGIGRDTLPSPSQTPSDSVSAPLGSPAPAESTWTDSLRSQARADSATRVRDEGR